MTPASPFANALAKQATVPRSQANITVRNISTPPPAERFASVYLLVKDGKAFIESNGKSESGLTVMIEPVFECPLELEAITRIVTQVAHTGYRLLSQEELNRLLDRKNQKNSPTLRATHSSSWKNLRETAVFYSIHPTDNETKWSLFLHNSKINYLSKKDEIKYPISTPLEELVRVILEDVKKYPHVLGKDVPVSTQ